MKITIKHEGKTKSGNIPDHFSQLTVKQFLALEAGVNQFQLLSVLSGLDLEYIENTNVNLEPALQKIFQVFNEKPKNLKDVPKKEVTFEGKTLKFPKKLDFTRFGQKAMVKNLLQNNEKIETIIAEVFAIYAQPIVDGKFISDRIPELTKKVEELPIIEVFPYAVFFFKKLKGLKIHLQIN